VATSAINWDSPSVRRAGRGLSLSFTCLVCRAFEHSSLVLETRSALACALRIAGRQPGPCFLAWSCHRGYAEPAGRFGCHVSMASGELIDGLGCWVGVLPAFLLYAGLVSVVYCESFCESVCVDVSFSSFAICYHTRSQSLPERSLNSSSIVFLLGYLVPTRSRPCEAAEAPPLRRRKLHCPTKKQQRPSIREESRQSSVGFCP
jgi:hypothetical protein